MKKLSLNFCLLFTNIITLNAIQFLYFEAYDFYDSEDFRVTSGNPPFPLICHYNGGGANTECSDFRINRERPQFNDTPESLKKFITENQWSNNNIEYFEAYCKLIQTDCNYFTHAWAMDRMVEDRKVSVSTGIFEAHNISPIKGQLGLGCIVPQTMSFHDKIYLSGNVAKFKIVNPQEIADAWFISVYNPEVNDGNINENKQQPKVILVHWYFFTNPLKIKQCPKFAEVVLNWNKGGMLPYEPQFKPAPTSFTSQ